MDKIVWSEWHNDSTRKVAATGPWMFAYGTSQWGFDLSRNNGVYAVTSDTEPYETIAGPFKTLAAAKAAYLLIGALKNDNP